MPSPVLLERLANTPLKLVTENDTSPWLTEANLHHFYELFRKPSLIAHFQPILDFRAQRYLGYEGLIRGPVDSPLYSPLILFDMAKQTGLTMEFERLCRHTVLTGFAALNTPEKLFINVSPSCLHDPAFINGETATLLAKLGLKTGQIIIEITENQNIGDFSVLRDTLNIYRNLGYEFAIDDLGEGFSNLRMWSEVRPEFVKIEVAPIHRTVSVS